MRNMLLALVALAASMLIAIPTQASERCSYEPQTPLPDQLFGGKNGFGSICDYIEQGPNPIFPDAYKEFYGIWEGGVTDSTNHSTGLVSVVIYENYADSKGVQAIYSWEGSGPLPAGHQIIRGDALVRGDGFLQGTWVGSRTGIHYTLTLRINPAGQMALRLDRRKGGAGNYSVGTLQRIMPAAVAALPAE